MSRSKGDGRHAVENGVIQHTSVSQMNMYDLCPRKWYYHKVERRPVPQTYAAGVGIDYHKELERYFKFEIGIAALSPRAKEALQWLPKRGDGLRVEGDLGKNFDILGVPVVGYIDLTDEREYALKHIMLIDYKTGKNKTKYAMSVNKLRTDLQMLTYGVWAKSEYPDAECLSWKHVNINTNDEVKSNERTVERIPVASVLEDWQKLAYPLVAGMKETVKKGSALEVETKEPDACQAYGGCPFKNICGKSPEKQFMANLLAGLEDKFSTEPDSLQNEPASTVKVETKVETKEPEVKSEVKKNVFPTFGEPAPAIPKPDEYKALVESVPADAVASILPPNVPESQLVDGMAFEEPKGKKTRGRKKAEHIEAPVAVSGDAKVSTPVEGIELFIDALPLDRPYELLDSYVAVIAAEVCTAFSVPDIRLIDFGKGKGALSAAIKARPPKPGVYVIFTMFSDLNAIAVEALMPLATKRTKGVR